MSAKNVALCKALGWTVEWTHPNVVAEGFYELHKPNGQIVAYHDKDEALSVIPDYEHDIAAGLAALDATMRKGNRVLWSLWPTWHGDKLEYYCSIAQMDTPIIEARERGATPAEACFAALCAYCHVEVEG